MANLDDLETLKRLSPYHPLGHVIVQEVMFLRGLIDEHERRLEALRHRENLMVEAMLAELELDRSAGSAARETPGASIEPRT